MSDRDVSPGEMYEPHDPRGHRADVPADRAGVDADTADLLADMRIAYASTPPAIRADLAALMNGSTAPAASPTPRRFERMRSSIIAKVGAATAAVVAATGGLAVAGALPAPVQDAMSHIGVGDAAHSDTKDGTTTTTVDPIATTVPTDPTTEVDNHGTDVSGVAHDPSTDGCEHGHDVANVASNGQSNGQPCETPTTLAGATTPTSIEDGHDGTDTSGDNNSGDLNQTSGDNGGDHNATSPTTVEQSHSGDNTTGSGDSNTSGSGGDQSGSNSSDGGSTSSGGGN